MRTYDWLLKTVFLYSVSKMTKDAPTLTTPSYP